MHVQFTITPYHTFHIIEHHFLAHITNLVSTLLLETYFRVVRKTLGKPQTLCIVSQAEQQ